MIQDLISESTIQKQIYELQSETVILSKEIEVIQHFPQNNIGPIFNFLEKDLFNFDMLKYTNKTQSQPYFNETIFPTFFNFFTTDISLVNAFALISKLEDEDYACVYDLYLQLFKTNYSFLFAFEQKLIQFLSEKKSQDKTKEFIRKSIISAFPYIDNSLFEKFNFYSVNTKKDPNDFLCKALISPILDLLKQSPYLNIALGKDTSYSDNEIFQLLHVEKRPIIPLNYIHKLVPYEDKNIISSLSDIEYITNNIENKNDTTKSQTIVLQIPKLSDKKEHTDINYEQLTLVERNLSKQRDCALHFRYLYLKRHIYTKVKYSKLGKEDILDTFLTRLHQYQNENNKNDPINPSIKKHCRKYLNELSKIEFFHFLNNTKIQTFNEKINMKMTEKDGSDDEKFFAFSLILLKNVLSFDKYGDIIESCLLLAKDVAQATNCHVKLPKTMITMFNNEEVTRKIYTAFVYTQFIIDRCKEETLSLQPIEEIEMDNMRKMISKIYSVDENQIFVALRTIKF